VLDRKILDMLPGRPPQVTFSCDNNAHTCSFQFWVAEVESFYCALEKCDSKTKRGYDTNATSYNCEKMKCSCIPDRFICGEDGSVGERCLNLLITPLSYPSFRHRRVSTRGD
jgi:hypothetical protein